MKIQLNFGPKDGKEMNLLLGRLSDTLIIVFKGKDYLYRRTNRTTIDGSVIYQFVDALVTSY